MPRVRAADGDDADGGAGGDDAVPDVWLDHATGQARRGAGPRQQAAPARVLAGERQREMSEMAFHISNFGKFATFVKPYADALGYVPEEGDERLAGYTEEEWAKHVTQAVAATEQAAAALDRWRQENP